MTTKSIGLTVSDLIFGPRPASADPTVEDLFWGTPLCPECRRVLPCEHPAEGDRKEKLDRLREAMARELRKSGYTVNPPGQGERLKTVPGINLKTNHQDKTS